MKSRSSLILSLLVACFFVAPIAAHAAAIPFFGPIIEKEWGQCALSWNAVILVVNNIIRLLLTLAIVFIAPLSIAYAGFLFVANPVDPNGISRAKAVLTHTIMGLVIALAGWMIVAALMAVLYNPSASSGGTTLGNWQSLITGNANEPCLDQVGVDRASVSEQRVSQEEGISTGAFVGPKPPPLSSFSPSFSEAQIQSAAIAAYVYTQSVCAAAQREGIANQCTTLVALIGVESGGSPRIESGDGAIGLMQLRPETAAENGVAACIGSRNSDPSDACENALRDTLTNINAGVHYYATLLNRFGGDRKYALAAYNAGPGSDVNADGTKQAFAPSTDCSSGYAWECPIDASGLVETQHYIGDVNAVVAWLESN